MCSTSATRSRTGTCMASGQAVDSSVCTSRGVAVSETQTSAQYSSCEYSPGYGGWSTCSGGMQYAAMTSCTRLVPQGNQSVGTNKCTEAGHPDPKAQSCQGGTFVCSLSTEMMPTSNVPPVNSTTPYQTRFSCTQIVAPAGEAISFYYNQDNSIYPPFLDATNANLAKYNWTRRRNWGDVTYIWGIPSYQYVENLTISPNSTAYNLPNNCVQTGSDTVSQPYLVVPSYGNPYYARGRISKVYFCD